MAAATVTLELPAAAVPFKLPDSTVPHKLCTATVPNSLRATVLEELKSCQLRKCSRPAVIGSHKLPAATVM